MYTVCINILIKVGVLFFLEAVANVDEGLGELFLEEVQPTDDQLMVSCCLLYKGFLSYPIQSLK